LERDDEFALQDDVSTDLSLVRSWASSMIHGTGIDYDSPPDAVALDLLPGWGDQWLAEPRQELRVLELHALESSTQRLLVGGRLAEAAACALKAVAMDPLRESSNRLLIEVYLREGNQIDAVRQYRQLQTLLASEIGVEPSPALIALVSCYFGHTYATPELGPLKARDRIDQRRPERRR
jgi:two-component SAPR family response regulator